MIKRFILKITITLLFLAFITWLSLLLYIKETLSNQIQSKFNNSFFANSTNFEIMDFKQSLFLTRLSSTIQPKGVSKAIKLFHEVRHGPIILDAYKPQLLYAHIKTSLREWPFQEKPNMEASSITNLSTDIDFNHQLKSYLSTTPFKINLNKQTRKNKQTKGVMTVENFSLEIDHEKYGLEHHFKNIQISFREEYENKTIPDLISNNITGEAKLFTQANGKWTIESKLNFKDYKDKKNIYIPKGNIYFKSSLGLPLHVEGKFTGDIKVNNINVSTILEGETTIYTNDLMTPPHRIHIPIKQLSLKSNNIDFFYKGVFDMRIPKNPESPRNIFDQISGNFKSQFTEETLQNIFWVLIPTKEILNGKSSLEEQTEIRRTLPKTSKKASEEFLLSPYYQKKEDGILSVEGNFANGTIELKSYE